MKLTKKKIKEILKFGESLVGTKRNESHKNYKVGQNKGPWWASDSKMPTKKEIKEGGTDCCGLMFLLRRYAGLPVEEIAKVGWFSYLKKNKKLQKFDYKKSYPAGTMLLREYNNIDFGHVGVIFKENKKGVLFSSLLHSVGWNDGCGKGVKIDVYVGKSYFYQCDGKFNKGHYTHVCLPDDWL